MSRLTRAMKNLYVSVLGFLIVESSVDLTCILFQDGRIDYGEFVAMMQKGNMGIGRRTMRNSLNMSMRDA